MVSDQVVSDAYGLVPSEGVFWLTSNHMGSKGVASQS